MKKEKKDLDLFDVENWLLTLSPILTVELTFACVPAAQGDQGDDTDEQDTASAYCSADNYQHRQGFWNKKSNGREAWHGGGRRLSREGEG